ncbi:MAG: cytidylate kinase-like family protein [Actinomycetota bacterium]|nr:cytidylate kinase-like family protein [Actinomycetota bacterium]
MPVITISASYGAGGSRIGPAVAERVGGHFVDRAIPAEVAARLEVPVAEARAHDDRASGGLLGILARVPNLSGVVLPEPENPLFQRETERLIREAAAHGDVVVLGRAGALVLADHPGALHVRLDGPVDARMRQAMQVEGVDRPEAKRRMRETDRARHAYVRHFYGVDARDCAHYHLVIDSTALTLDACVELIVAGAMGRAPRARRAPHAAPEASS